MSAVQAVRSLGLRVALNTKARYSAKVPMGRRHRTACFRMPFSRGRAAARSGADRNVGGPDASGPWPIASHAHQSSALRRVRWGADIGQPASGCRCPRGCAAGSGADRNVGGPDAPAEWACASLRTRKRGALPRLPWGRAAARSRADRNVGGPGAPAEWACASLRTRKLRSRSRGARRGASQSTRWSPPAASTSTLPACRSVWQTTSGRPDNPSGPRGPDGFAR